jgi:PTH1 family peptidyl-tRNA hydrolase
MSRIASERDQVCAVIGLGNPGREYERTRHNAGFWVVDELASRFNVPMHQRKVPALWGWGWVRGRKVLLVKPTTFMNRSGEAAAPIARYHGIAAEQILVVHDDLDLPPGRIKVARGGGAGGHRGVQSLIQHFGCNDFHRLKLGIGRPRFEETVEEFVLRPPYEEEAEVLREAVFRAVDAAEMILEDGVEAAMNRFNRRVEPGGTEDLQT